MNLHRVPRRGARARLAPLHFALSCVLAWSVLSTSFARTQGPAQTPERVELPPGVPDPIEPVNRVLYSINQGLMMGLVQPTAKVYRRIVFRPIRASITHVGKNVTYPSRLINNLLQGKWTGARDETYRFLCNSTLGIGGLFDVATKYKIPRSEEDFGQTFGHWGWKPHCFLMLPLYGPSNERDAVGLLFEKASQPLLYVPPYDFTADNPITYNGPYTYFNYGVTYNNLSDNVDEYVRFGQSEMDPYAQIQYVWSFARETRVADVEIKGEQELASLETIASIFFTFRDPEFPGRGKTRSVVIPTTGRKLKFSVWVQPRTAPVVYIVPGLGTHRLARPCLALAELIYNQGYSVVSVSSAFHSEFMEQASTADMPAYLPFDAHDVHVALTEIDHRLQALHPNRFGPRALLGYSMGGLHTLYIAATQATNASPLIKFDRFVAINSPVRLLHGVLKLDQYYRAPLDWPESERVSNLENTFLKVAALTRAPLTPDAALPLSAIESRFLIGATFRFILRDIIFSSQRRHNQGILTQPLKNLRRAPAYEEILQYSYRDYFEKFALPYYQERNLELPARETLGKAGNLRTYEGGLRDNPNIWFLTNQNDFLLSDDDLAWIRATFSPSQLTVFEHGGHLGNLFNPDVQKKIIDALSGMKSSPAGSP